MHFQLVAIIEIDAGVEIDEEAVLKEANDKNPWFVMCTHMFNDPLVIKIFQILRIIFQAEKEVIRHR